MKCGQATDQERHFTFIMSGLRVSILFLIMAAMNLYCSMGPGLGETLRSSCVTACNREGRIPGGPTWTYKQDEDGGVTLTVTGTDFSFPEIGDGQYWKAAVCPPSVSLSMQIHLRSALLRAKTAGGCTGSSSMCRTFRIVALRVVRI